jgi:hypothetical protein
MYKSFQSFCRVKIVAEEKRKGIGEILVYARNGTRTQMFWLLRPVLLKAHIEP